MSAALDFNQSVEGHMGRRARPKPEARESKPQTPEVKKAYTIREVCERLSINRNTLRSQLIAKKKLRAFKVGAKVLVSAEELERFIRDSTERGRTA